MLKLTEMIQMGALGFKPADIKKFGESGIESKDIIELAKNGYSAADVDELISLSKEQGTDTTAAQSSAEKTQPDEEASRAAGEQESEDNKKDPRDDEIEKLKAEIKKLQDVNASKDLGQPKTITHDDQVKEILKGIY